MLEKEDIKLCKKYISPSNNMGDFEELLSILQERSFVEQKNFFHNVLSGEESFRDLPCRILSLEETSGDMSALFCTFAETHRLNLARVAVARGRNFADFHVHKEEALRIMFETATEFMAPEIVNISMLACYIADEIIASAEFDVAGQRCFEFLQDLVDSGCPVSNFLEFSQKGLPLWPTRKGIRPSITFNNDLIIFDFGVQVSRGSQLFHENTQNSELFEYYCQMKDLGVNSRDAREYFKNPQVEKALAIGMIQTHDQLLALVTHEQKSSMQRI